MTCLIHHYAGAEKNPITKISLKIEGKKIINFSSNAESILGLNFSLGN